MKYDYITVGKTYEINFVDPNYPCHCGCHTNPCILHIMPCCDDKSYVGPALCVVKLENGMIGFAISNIRAVIIHPEHVSQQSTTTLSLKKSFVKGLVKRLKDVSHDTEG